MLHDLRVSGEVQQNVRGWRSREEGAGAAYQLPGGVVLHHLEMIGKVPNNVVMIMAGCGGNILGEGGV